MAPSESQQAGFSRGEVYQRFAVWRWDFGRGTGRKSFAKERRRGRTLRGDDGEGKRPTVRKALTVAT
jgi:hypothetical protein